MRRIRPLAAPRRVYCAGPLFNDAERREMLAIAGTLQAAGFDTFVPHDDGLEFAQVQPYLIEQGYEATHVGQWVHEAVFALDVYQVVVGCGPLVFNMNGRVPDEGAVAETAIAWTLGKPIVLFKEDARSFIVGRDNPLIAGMARFETVASMEQLPAAVAAAVDRCELSREVEVPAPDTLAQPLAAGNRLWQLLQQQHAAHNVPAIAALVLELFKDQNAQRVS